MKQINRSSGKCIEFEDIFDRDKELEVSMYNDNNDCTTIWLSPNEVNEIISHLSNLLTSIDEPIQLLTDLNIKPTKHVV